MIDIEQRRIRKRDYMRRKRLDVEWKVWEMFRQRIKYLICGRPHSRLPEYRFQRKCREAGIKMTIAGAREFLAQKKTPPKRGQV